MACYRLAFMILISAHADGHANGDDDDDYDYYYDDDGDYSDMVVMVTIRCRG